MDGGPDWAHGLEFANLWLLFANFLSREKKNYKIKLYFFWS